MYVMTAEGVGGYRARDRQPGTRLEQTSLHPAGAAGRPAGEERTQGPSVLATGRTSTLQKVQFVTKLNALLISTTQAGLMQKLTINFSRLSQRGV